MNYIKGYKNLYKVTRDGHIWNIILDKELKQSKDSSGYFQVSLKGKQALVHRLVAESFISNFENKPEVNHKDGIKTNNNVDNLEWVTHSENIQHAYDIGLMNNQGENHPSSKLDNIQVGIIKKLLKLEILKQKYISAFFDVSRSTITDIKKNRTWSHI